VEALVAGDAGARQLGSRVFAAAAVGSAGERLRALVDEAHAAQPLEPGVSLQTIRSRLGVAEELMDALLAEAVRGGELDVTRGTAARAGWEPRLSAEQATVADRIVSELREAGEEPPTVDELASRHGPGVPALLRLLERRGSVVVLGGERAWSAPVLETVMDRLHAGMEPGRGYAPAELREVAGLSRRLLIPVLEHADRIGVTRREGEGRVRRER
jgi:selenocysteine-specific elongation factor